LDPTPTRPVNLVDRCGCVLIALLSDHFEDPLGPYQEV